MKLFRITRRLHRQSHDLDALTPRLLEDVGLERKENRSIVGSMIASFAAGCVVEMIRQR